MTENRARAAARPDAAKKKKLNPWVENIESLVVAVVLALIIRVFVLEAFVIPTGSMAGSLYGNHYDVTCENCGYKYAFGQSDNVTPDLTRVLCPNCGWRPSRLPSPSGGDRILVNKVIYRFDQPRRWDPFVFVNPTCKKGEYPPRTTYIKRLVGLPDDRLEILRGDLVVNGEIQRKPAAAQETLWMPVYDGDHPWRLEHPQGKPWRTDGKTWRLDGTRLVVDAPKDRDVWANYSGRLFTDSGVIRDTYGYDHDLANPENRPANGAGLNVVADLRLSFDVTASGAGTLALVLERDDSDERVTFDLAGGAAEVARYSPLGNATKQELLAKPLVAIADGKPHRIVFSRVDYLLTLAVDGKTVAERDLWKKSDYEAMRNLGLGDGLKGHTHSGVKLGARGAALELKHVRIDRDVYYTYPRGRDGDVNQYVGPWKIPERCYFALGDNSPESWDSRYWHEVRVEPWVPAEYLIGKALVIWWHPLRIRLIH